METIKVVGNKVLENDLQCRECYKKVKNSKLYIQSRTVNYSNKTYILDFQCTEGHNYMEVTPYEITNLSERVITKADKKTESRGMARDKEEWRIR